MQKSLKLIVEDVDVDSFEYLVEEKNNNSEPKYYIKGPFVMVDEKNQNGRVYESSEMDPCIETYNEKFVNTKRALNELNHPEQADVNLERACDMTLSLVKEGNVYIGKALCLSTPMGKLQESLIRDGVKLGKSTRCLGQLVESNGTMKVKSPRMIATDTVWEPSGQGKNASCFVNGILENKDFIINYNNTNEIIYDGFHESIGNLPKKDVESYLMENILNFINKVTINGKK
jgi:hypothetical protein